MAIDASIYDILRPVPEMPSVLDSAQKAASLSQLGMQQMQMQRQMQVQQALRDSYAKNTDANGVVNKSAVLSDLRAIDPTFAASHEEQLGKAEKATAEAGTASTDSFNKKAAIFAGTMHTLSQIPEDQRAAAWPQIIGTLQKQGVVNVEKQGIPTEYNPKWFNDTATLAQTHMGENTPEYLANQLKKTEIAAAPIKYNADLYGSRSPNAELTSQYSKDVATIRGSQNAMNQMMDNYHHPSPQGDASLVLNAFKIKFPTAPDVNSLEELTKSQSVPDTWKQRAAHALQGGLDQGTRDNLLRDAVSTYRANYDSYQGIKDRYDARAKKQNVDDPTLTYEPAIEKTYKNAMALQDKIGPYVPPTERPGLIGALTRAIRGNENEGTAYAADKKPAITPGDTAALQYLSDPKTDKSSPDYFSVRAKLKARGLVK